MQLKTVYMMIDSFTRLPATSEINYNIKIDYGRIVTKIVRDENQI